MSFSPPQSSPLRDIPDPARPMCIGCSPAWRSVLSAIELVRRSDATVLIRGESGTGKELVARAIHDGSPRRDGPFVTVACGALEHGLIDSDLFGHVPGAFTGAVRPRPGLLARADGGTLLLDEVGELSLGGQARLERFLQEREFVPLGGAAPRRVDVRILATTNRDLHAAVARGTFRRELLFRLQVVPIDLPPLRQRPEDIPELAAFFLARSARAAGAVAVGFTPAAMAALLAHDWPGNVRQLQNTVEQAVVLHPDRRLLSVEDLPPLLPVRAPRSAAGSPGTPVTYHEAMARAERAYLEELFRRTRGNISHAARLAGLSRGHLHRKLNRLGLVAARFRTKAS